VRLRVYHDQDRCLLFSPPGAVLDDVLEGMIAVSGHRLPSLAPPTRVVALPKGYRS